MATCDRLYCLTLGHQTVARWICIEDGGDELVRSPSTAVLARSPDGWFLLDTGLSRDVAAQPELQPLWFPWTQAEFPGPGDPLLETLELCGVGPGDVAGVAISHLHGDHTGGLRHFAGGPPVLVQRAELEFGATAAVEQGYWRPDYEDHGLRWQPLDGDAPIAAGIDAISTPGHTPGHMAFRVRTAESGTWLFPFDAILTAENLELDRTGGRSAAPGDMPKLRESQDRLVELASAEDARIVPGHCPVTWPTLLAPPEYYR